MKLKPEQETELKRKAYEFRLSKWEEKLESLIANLKPYVEGNYLEKELKNSIKLEGIAHPYSILRNFQDKRKEIERVIGGLSEEGVSNLAGLLEGLPWSLKTTFGVCEEVPEIRDDKDLQRILKSSELYKWIKRTNTGELGL